MTDALETRLALPITKAVTSAEGQSSFRHADSGIGNLQLGVKWNFLKDRMPLAAALDLDLPTANSANNPASLGQRYSTQIQQGFNAHLQVIADTPKMADLLTGHASVGYMNTGAYTTAAKTRFNPSDLMTFGASLDLSMERWIHHVSLSAEAVGNTGLSHSKSNSTMNGSDLGTVIEVGPAVRYQVGALRAYTGFLADVGKATYRAYNYRVNFGVSMLWGGAQ